jgi:hypothetical protein
MSDDNQRVENCRFRSPDIYQLAAEFYAFKELMNERDTRYKERFDGQERETKNALAAQKEATASALAASDKAILKQEGFQNNYNASHNDLTRKMDAQYKEMVPRPEAVAKFDGLNDKIEEVKKILSETKGRTAGVNATWALVITLAIIAIGVIGLILKKP